MIEGPTIRLRALETTEADVEAMWRWQNDWSTQHIGDGEPPLAVSREGVRAMFGPGSGFVTFMIEQLDGTLIGNCGYYRYSARSRSCEVGIWIGEAAARGKGHGTEAMRLLLWYLFHQMGLHRVGLTVVADNAAAIASYHKCGYREEGRQRDAVFRDRRWIDMLLMSVLEDEVELGSLDAFMGTER